MARFRSSMTMSWRCGAVARRVCRPRPYPGAAGGTSVVCSAVRPPLGPPSAAAARAPPGRCRRPGWPRGFAGPGASAPPPCGPLHLSGPPPRPSLGPCLRPPGCSLRRPLRRPGGSRAPCLAPSRPALGGGAPCVGWGPLASLRAGRSGAIAPGAGHYCPAPLGPSAGPRLRCGGRGFRRCGPVGALPSLLPPRRWWRRCAPPPGRAAPGRWGFRQLLPWLPPALRGVGRAAPLHRGLWAAPSFFTGVKIPAPSLVLCAGIEQNIIYFVQLCVYLYHILPACKLQALFSLRLKNPSMQLHATQ